jgi:hypothetical protein
MDPVKLPQRRSPTVAPRPRREPEEAPDTPDINQGVPVSDWRALPLAGTPSPSNHWPGYRCADVDEPNRRISLWFREEEPDATAALYPGSCAEWANQGAEIPREPDGGGFEIPYDGAEPFTV